MGTSIRSAVVVGAGLSGLAASVALARRGIDVVLAEAGEAVGAAAPPLANKGLPSTTAPCTWRFLRC